MLCGLYGLAHSGNSRAIIVRCYSAGLNLDHLHRALLASTSVSRLVKEEPENPDGTDGCADAQEKDKTETEMESDTETESVVLPSRVQSAFSL